MEYLRYLKRAKVKKVGSFGSREVDFKSCARQSIFIKSNYSDLSLRKELKKDQSNVYSEDSKDAKLSDDYCQSMSRVNPTLPSSSSELSMSKDRSFKSYSEKVCYKDEEKFKRSVQFDDRSPEIIREPYHDDDGTNFPAEDDYDCKTITLRSSLVGLLMAIAGASVAQLFVFKPVHMRLQPTFIQISCMLIGRAFAKVPGGEWWNPGPFSIKESTFSGIVATSAGAGAFAIELAATEELYFDRVRNFWISLAILISSQAIGFGWAGLLQPILVYPEKVHYPDVLPSVALYYSMFSEGEEVKDQARFFKRAFLWMGFC